MPEIERFVPARVDWPTVMSALGAIVATDDDSGAVVGVLVRWPHPQHVLVERLVVAPLARRGGIGGTLLDVAEREAVESGTNTVRAAATGSHVPLLLGRGYRVVGARLEKRL